MLLDDDCLQIEDVFTALQAYPPDQAKKGSIVQDLADEIVTLTSSVLDRDRRLQTQNGVINDLAEENIQLKKDLNHRLEQARRPFRHRRKVTD